jgi:hypothetical protein
MITLYIESLYYCFFKEKPTTDKIIDHIEKLADHEIEYIMNKFNHIKSKRVTCC